MATKKKNSAERQILIVGPQPTTDRDVLAEFMEAADGTLRQIVPLSGKTRRRCIVLLAACNATAGDWLDYWTRDDCQNLRFKLKMLPTVVASHPGKVILESRTWLAPELLKSHREKAMAGSVQ